MNIDATGAAAATAAFLTGKEREDTLAFFSPTLLTPADDAPLEAALANAEVAKAAKVAADANLQDVVEELSGRAEEGVKPIKKNKFRAFASTFCASAKKFFKGSNNTTTASLEAASITFHPTIASGEAAFAAAYELNRDAVANRKAALRAAAAPIVAPIPESAILAAAAAAAAAAAEVEVQATVAPPPRPRRRSSLSCSAGMFPCHAVMVLGVEAENEVAAPVVAPVPAPAAASRRRSLSVSEVLFYMRDRSGSSGGMIASFGVIDTGIVPAEGEGEEEVVVAPVEEEVKEEV